MMRLCVIWRCEERRNGVSGDQHDIDKNYLGRRNNGTYIFDATSATGGRKWSFFFKCDIFSFSPLKAALLRIHPFTLFTIYV